MGGQDKLEFIPSPYSVLAEGSETSPRYLIVRLYDQGRITLEGSRESVNDFLIECAHSGLVIQMDHLSWCG